FKAIEKVMVIGAGQRGSGIAQVFAQSGFEVLLNDMNEQALDKGMNNIEKLLERAVEKERMTEQAKEETIARLSKATDIKDAEDHDLIVEAVVENMDVKADVIKQVDEIDQTHA